ERLGRRIPRRATDRNPMAVPWGRHEPTLYSIRWSPRCGATVPEAPLNPRFFRNGIVMLLLVVVALAVVLTVVNQTTPNSNVAYSKFLDNVQAGQVTSALQEGSTLTVTAKDNTKYNVVIPGLLANQVLDDMTQA